MTRFLLMVVGALGLAVVGQTAVYYRGIDSLAFGITLLMAGFFVAALIELFSRTSITERLLSELQALVKKVPLEDLSSAPSELRGILRAELENQQQAQRGPVFTPFIVGLLVMLGLLGTFLGLFETLRGAHEALAASADIDALRAGLSTPMAGLMRSFGTSAAGVASSAMLGLAAVFVRRRGRALTSAIRHAAAHELSNLSASRRQLSSLEALAEQGRAIPAAATALQAAADALAEIRAAQKSEQEANVASMVEFTRVSSDAAAKAIGELSEKLAANQKHFAVTLEELSETLRTGAKASAEASKAGFVELREASLVVLEKAQKENELAVTRFENAMEAREVAARDKSVEWIAELQAQVAKGASDAAASSLEGMNEQTERVLSALQGTLDSGFAKFTSEVAERLSSVAEGYEQSANTIAMRTGALMERLESAATLRGELVSEADAKFAAHTGALVMELQSLRDAHLDKEAEVHAAWQSALMASQGEQVARLSALSELESRIEERLSSALAATAERLEAQQVHDVEAAERMEEVTRLLESSTRQIADAADAQRHDAAGLEARAMERLQDVIGAFETRSKEQEERLLAFETRLSEHQQQSAESLRGQLQEEARALAAELAGTGAIVRDAASLVQSSGAELTAAAEMFTGAVDRHSEAAERWLDGLSEVERAVEEAGGEAAVSVLRQYLTRTHELFDQQLGFQQELFNQLQEAREVPGA